jgi:putative FmdB family regulatory protein
MPIYEYRCLDCRKRTSVLVLSARTAPPGSCPHCKGHRLERILSRFAAPKSEEARMEALADPSKYGDLDENDPQSMARLMKRMGQEMGEDFGDDLDAAMEESESEREPTGSGLGELD